MGKPEWIFDKAAGRATVVVWTAPRNAPEQLAHAVTGSSGERGTLCGLMLHPGILYLTGAEAHRAACERCREILKQRKGKQPV